MRNKSLIFSIFLFRMDGEEKTDSDDIEAPEQGFSSIYFVTVTIWILNMWTPDFLEFSFQMTN
jgi:hypothetical protein